MNIASTISVYGALALTCVVAVAALGRTTAANEPSANGVPSHILFSGTPPWEIKPSTAPEYRLVKSIALQTFFHTAKPWEIEIYQPITPPDEPAPVWYPVEVCIFGPGDPQPPAGCQPLVYGESLPNGLLFPMQEFESATLEMLPGLPGKPARPSLVVRASYLSGVASELDGVYVWNDTPRLGVDKRNFDSFFLTFSSVIDQTGQQVFVKQGALSGSFISVGQIMEGDEANLESPRYYEIGVYRPASFGYVKVLGLLSQKRYPSNNTGDGLRDPIAALTAEISRALNSVYPSGVSKVVH